MLFRSGRKSILFWEEKRVETTFYYPYENMEKIQNYLNVKDLIGIEKELNSIEEELFKKGDSISTENVPLIFNQIAGILTKYMMQHRVPVGKIQGTKDDIYTRLSHQETLSDYKQVLVSFCQHIFIYLGETVEEENSKGSYSKQIIDYLNEYYAEDILYEELAERIGISYSYLRRIVKEETGKSVSDYVNKIRIEKMKAMLLTSDESLVSIAEKVGYHNMQSVTRYFRKFEGITPKEFKANQKYM